VFPFGFSLDRARMRRAVRAAHVARCLSYEATRIERFRRRRAASRRSLTTRLTHRTAWRRVEIQLSACGKSGASRIRFAERFAAFDVQNANAAVNGRKKKSLNRLCDFFRFFSS
jgi:hypothetical protein